MFLLFNSKPFICSTIPNINLSCPDITRFILLVHELNTPHFIFDRVLFQNFVSYYFVGLNPVLFHAHLHVRGMSYVVTLISIDLFSVELALWMTCKCISFIISAYSHDKFFVSKWTLGAAPNIGPILVNLSPIFGGLGGAVRFWARSGQKWYQRRHFR